MLVLCLSSLISKESIVSSFPDVLDGAYKSWRPFLLTHITPYFNHFPGILPNIMYRASYFEDGLAQYTYNVKPNCNCIGAQEHEVYHWLDWTILTVDTVHFSDYSSSSQNLSSKDPVLEHQVCKEFSWWWHLGTLERGILANELFNWMELY